MAKNILSTFGDSIKPAVRRFAEGGEVKETPDQLIARMAATYGTGNPKPAPVAPPPAPAPAPVAAPPAPAPAKQNIFSILAGRKALVDKAVGAATGYANGGKIEGPGTPTSDSIAATVADTGEAIQVSTDERILSAAQDALLQVVAKGMGYASLDELLEKGTCQPVGPTIKGGKRAAANGMTDVDYRTVQNAVIGQQAKPALAPMNPAMSNVVTGSRNPVPSAPLPPTIDATPSVTPQPRAAAPKPTIVVPDGVDMAAYTPEPGINPIAQIGRFLSDSANAARGNGSYAENRLRSQSSAAAQLAAPPVVPVVPAPAAVAQPAPIPENPISGAQEHGAPAQSPAIPAQPVPVTAGAQFFAAGTPQAQAIAAKVADRGFVPEAGQGLVTSSSGRAVSIDSRNPLAPPQFAPRVTLEALVQERARRALAGDLAGAHALSGSIAAMAATAGTGLDTRIKQQSVAQNELAANDKARISRLIDELNDPSLTPEQLRAKLQTLYAAQGRGKTEQRYLPMHNVKIYDEMGHVIGEEAGGFFDTLTGQAVAATQKAPAARLDIRVGMPVKAPDGVHTFQGKTLTVKGGKVTGVQ